MFSLRADRLLRFAGLMGAAIALLIACQSPSPQSSNPSPNAQPLIVATSPWPGFVGHYVAIAQEFPKAEGVVIEDKPLQVATDVNTALVAGKVDLAWTGVPDMVTLAGQAPDLRLILLSDYSNGADGILARNVTTVEQLKGKEVAWEGLPLQAFLLRKYLQTGGLVEKDIQLKVMNASDAAAAFAAKRIDGAVTYEPWLTKAAKEGQGTVIFSSKDTNIIPVGLVAKSTTIADRKPEIVAYLKAVQKGLQFYKDNPKDADAIVAKSLGVTAAEVPDLLQTIRLMSIEDNKTITFNPSNSLNVVDSLEFAAKTGKEIKIVAPSVDAKTLYDDSLVKAL
jgi:NitT/TauT family transport system substrate-binding protein